MVLKKSDFRYRSLLLEFFRGVDRRITCRLNAPGRRLSGVSYCSRYPLVSTIRNRPKNARNFAVLSLKAFFNSIDPLRTFAMFTRALISTSLLRPLQFL